MEINANELTIVNDTMPSRRMVKSKYHDVFEAMQQGQRIVCPPGTAARIATQYRKWLAQRDIKAEVRAFERCDDGKGGVWLVSITKPVATRWNTPGGAMPSLPSRFRRAA